MQLESISLIDALFSEVNPIPVKAALNIMGYDFSVPRMPLTDATSKTKETLTKEMKRLKII